MKDSGYTSQERSFILLMRIWAVAFAFAGTIFAAIPEVMLNYINNIGHVFFGWLSPPVEGGGYFWLILAVALLFSLSYGCIMAQIRPLRNQAFAQIVIVAKFVSSIGFVSALVLGYHQFYYLVGAIVDGLIFLITLRIYTRALSSRN